MNKSCKCLSISRALAGAPLLMATLLLGCTDEMPTDVQNTQLDVVEPNGPTTSIGSEPRTSALGAVEDGLVRIMPALTDQTAAKPLQVALIGLRTALADADMAGIPALIDAAHGAVNRYARTGFDAADLETIRLTLDYTALAITNG
jgi:hypothetical protein